MYKKNVLLNLLNTFSFSILIIVIWYIVKLIPSDVNIFIPYPHKVIQSIFKIVSDLKSVSEVLSTLLKILSSFTICCLVGTPIGLLIGKFRLFQAGTDLVIDFFRSLPAVALFPMFMLYFGIGDLAKVLTAAFSCCLIVIINTAYGVKSVNPIKIKLSYMMGASAFEVFYRIIFMESLPHIFIGFRNSISYAVIIIVATEMFIGNQGIGRQIYDAQLNYNVEFMFAYIFIAGIIGYLLNQLFVYLERKVTHWYGK